MATCNVISSETSAGNDPDGGGLYGLNLRDGTYSRGVHVGESTLLSVQAELAGWTGVVPNDGTNLMSVPIIGTITHTLLTQSGYSVAYKNTSSYTIPLPFIDNLFQGAVPLVAPFSAYWLITEDYRWNAYLVVGGTISIDRFRIVRKVRPLAAGGLTQVVSSIMV